ncbi:unnamed protein product, partial [Mesorhabditis spiculigera]
MISYPRSIYVVRHCEREDNINRQWRKIKGYEQFDRDNSPLSSRGKQQALELQKHFANIHIDHCFASPFDRTMETAHTICSSKGLAVKPEPGLCEVLYLCVSPPSFWNADKLKDSYSTADVDYLPAFTKHTLPREGMGDDACCDRVSRMLDYVTTKYSGDLLLVSHGAAIGAINQRLNGEFTYVGQATITKYTESAQGKFKQDFANNPNHLTDKSNLRPW